MQVLLDYEPPVTQPYFILIPISPEQIRNFAMTISYPALGFLTIYVKMSDGNAIGVSTE